MIALPSESKQILYVTGMPRAGSTLLCQLLGMHPAIYSIGHSSPLASLLDQCRTHLSDNHFFLGQLDVDFDLTYTRLINAYRGMMAGWFAETDLPVVVDKNRVWLALIETVKQLDPQFKMLVCVRDPITAYGSIEAQHRKTVLLDFQDHMAPHSAYERARVLFAANGVVGAPLAAIQQLHDIPDPTLAAHLFYVRFEDLLRAPQASMAAIFAWAGLPAHSFDPQQLPVKPHESDSYNRFKYRHTTFSQIRPANAHQVSGRIAEEIRSNYRWFYQSLYPELAATD
jgi:sulfotransferase